VVTSLDLDPSKMEQHNVDLSEKYKKMSETEVRFETIDCDDADYLYVAYGSSARICQKSIKLGREKGIKLGLLRPITLFPFPYKKIEELCSQVKGIISVEMNSGQMIEDIRLAVEGRVPVKHFGRTGGIIPSPDEVLDVLEQTYLT
jgi:2-oxoglutarate ferredoxin oxidoreductase subunit alpha